MSTVSPLPLPPFDEPESESAALRQEIAERIKQNRRRRGLDTRQEEKADTGPSNPLAAAVAQRFEKAVSYQEFFAAEAEEARRQAEAAANLARRQAEALAEMAADLEEWNARIAAANAANPHFIGGDVVQQPAINPFTVEPPLLATPAEEPAIAATTAADLFAPAVEESVQEPEPEAPVFVEPAQPLPTNLIEFPRQLVAARKARPRLAEGPLAVPAQNTQLRIFEVEADQISTRPEPAGALPEWSGMRLDARMASAAALPQAQVSLLVTPQTAPFSRRVMAGMVDLCCVATALLVFVFGAAWASPVLPTGKMAIGVVAAVGMVLWISYQMLFFTLAGATPGMRYARIGLCTFTDENPTRGAMRMRILSTLLSVFPVGLGLLWAFLDDDGLGWHDRISRMYQRAY